MVSTKVIKGSINVIESRVNEYLYMLQTQRRVQILNVQWLQSIIDNEFVVMIVFDVLD
jgi:hypothetical protein